MSSQTFKKLKETLKSESGPDLESGNPYNRDFKYLDFHRDRLEKLFGLLEEYYIPGSTMLDIGSLFGYACLGAKLIGYQASGLDLPQYVEKFSSRFASWGIDNRPCDLSCEAMPFSDAAFDIIIAAEIVEHFRFHPLSFFQEAARVLKPGGRLIITTPNLTRFNNVAKLILGQSINWDIKDEYWDGAHQREFTTAELKYLAGTAGLETEAIRYEDFDYPDLGKITKLANKIIGTILPSRRRNIVIILRRSI